jgi:hypothetical protein
LQADDDRLVEGAFFWPSSTRTSANWIVRRYNLPRALHGKVGTKIRLKISYMSIVPMSLPLFTFSTPWIVDGIRVRVLVEGSFDYFVASHRLVPQAKPISVKSVSEPVEKLHSRMTESCFPGPR